MNPYADYLLVLERQRELEEEAAARAHGDSRVLALVTALAGRFRPGRA